MPHRPKGSSLIHVQYTYHLAAFSLTYLTRLYQHHQYVFVFSPHFRIYADCYLFQYEGFRFIPIDASPLDLIIKTPAARVPAQASQEPPGSVA